MHIHESRASCASLCLSFYSNLRVARTDRRALLGLLLRDWMTIKIARFSSKLIILRFSLMELIIRTRGDNTINVRMFTVVRCCLSIAGPCRATSSLSCQSQSMMIMTTLYIRVCTCVNISIYCPHIYPFFFSFRVG